MVYSILLNSEIKQKLVDYANKTGNSVAAVIRIAVIEYLESKRWMKMINTY